MEDWFKSPSFYLIALAPLTVAIAGGFITSRSIKSGWYDTVPKPSWAPPRQAFGLIWTILYFLIALSTWAAYQSASNKWTVMAPFAVQMALNLLWTVAFFGMKNPKLALVVLLLLIAASLWQFVAMWKVNTDAATLFLPYLAWLCVAFSLNVRAISV